VASAPNGDERQPSPSGRGLGEGGPNVRRAQYSRKSRDRAREQRRDPTDAEDGLWRFLRDRSVVHAKFRRQHPFGPFILDFYCHERRLAVEVDGGQHLEPAAGEYDRRRTDYLRGLGIRVLRFNNVEVLTETESVMQVILEALEKPSPNPLPEGEG
jgi:very-short-patch-repair endonuclease